MKTKLLGKRLIAICVCTLLLATHLFVLGGSGNRDEKLVKAEEITKELLVANNEEYKGECSAYYIKGLDEQEDYILVASSDKGYAIYTTEFQLIEYSPYDESPYGDSAKADSYYAGPANYFEKEEDDEIKNIHTGKKLEKEEKQKMSKAVKDKLKEIHEQDKLETKKAKELEKEQKNQEKENKVKTIDEQVLSTSKVANQEVSTLSLPGADSIDDIKDLEQTGSIEASTKISDYQFFLVPPLMGNNDNYTCPSVAVQLLLAYNNWSKDGRIIPAKFLYRYEQGTTNLKEELQEKPYHKEYISGTGVEDASSLDLNKDPMEAETLFEYLVLSMNSIRNMPLAINGIKNGIKEYLGNFCGEIEDEIIVNGYGYPNTNDLSILRNEIDNDRPAITMIHYIDSEGDYKWHHVVTYGYQSLFINGVSTRGFMAHFGWTDKNCIWFNENWCLGFVTMQSSHQHSKQALSANSHILECSTCGGRSTNNQHVFVEHDRISNSDSQNAKHYHYSICTCGYKQRAEHAMSYRTAGYYNHNSTCVQCGYTTQEEHYMKYGYCYYCGQLEFAQ